MKRGRSSARRMGEECHQLGKRSPPRQGFFRTPVLLGRSREFDEDEAIPGRQYRL